MIKTATLLIGHGSRSEAAVAEYYQFAEQLADRLDQQVEACFLEFADPPIIDGIKNCIENGANQIVALPLFLGPAGHQKNDVPAVINWARKEWPHVKFAYGSPLGAQFHIAKVLAGRIKESTADLPDVADEDTAIVVVGRGSRDPDSNSEVAKLARLLYEGRSYQYVDQAYFSLAKPGVKFIVSKYAKLGVKRIVLLPYLLFTGKIYERIVEQAQEAAVENDVEVVVSHYLFPHDNLYDAVYSRFEEVVAGTATMTCDLCKYRRRFEGFEAEFALPQKSDPSHGMRGVPHDHGLLSKMDDMLPPQYQGENQASLVPMAAADLVYDANGAVAWNSIWEDFCDLALAGGPAHRATLLVPPAPNEVMQNPQAYANVVAEITRGLQMTTNCDVVQSITPGWVGLQCHSEDMAVWLMRAIIAENVLARREENTLMLPAGPDFTVSGEIKNVVTVVAKSFHYWTEHMQWKLQQEK